MLKFKGITDTGAERANLTENSPLSSVDKMKKMSTGTYDVVADSISKVTLARWKVNKVVTIASTMFGKEPMKKTKRFIKDRGGSAELNKPNSIPVYGGSMTEVDRMDQNIGAYMINFGNKKWWWLLFRFSFDLALTMLPIIPITTITTPAESSRSTGVPKRNCQCLLFNVSLYQENFI